MYSSNINIVDDITKLQADILTENLLDNPYFRYNVIMRKNKQLSTDAQTIVGAINEINSKLKNIDLTHKNNLAVLYDVIGPIGSNPELTQKLTNKSGSLIELLLKVDDIITLGGTGSSAGDITYNEQIDNFYVGASPQSFFQLTKKPIDVLENLEMRINGIVYRPSSTGDPCGYDGDRNGIVWSVSTMFEIKNDMNVEIKYRYQID